MRKDGVAGSSTTRGGNPVGSESKGRNSRNLPYPKFLKRREEGRCFCCGGPFNLRHHCREKSLGVVLLAEDKEEDQDAKKEDVEQKPMELSVFSASGLTQPKTMKLQ